MNTTVLTIFIQSQRQVSRTHKDLRWQAGLQWTCKVFSQHATDSNYFVTSQEKNNCFPSQVSELYFTIWDSATYWPAPAFSFITALEALLKAVVKQRQLGSQSNYDPMRGISSCNFWNQVWAFISSAIKVPSYEHMTDNFLILAKPESILMLASLSDFRYCRILKV